MLMWIQFETRLWRMYILIKLNELSSCLQRPWSHPSIPAGSGGQAKHNKLRPNYRLNLFMTVHFSKTKQCECSHFNCNTATWGISQETVSSFAATDCKAKNPPPGGTPQQTLPQSACVRKKRKPSLDTLICCFFFTFKCWFSTGCSLQARAQTSKKKKSTSGRENLPRALLRRGWQWRRTEAAACSQWKWQP